jgi:hypothetical protein
MTIDPPVHEDFRHQRNWDSTALSSDDGEEPGYDDDAMMSPSA